MKYFLGTLEINRGGGYCEQAVIFKCDIRPAKMLWVITKSWYPTLSSIDETHKVAYFEDWMVSIRPHQWLEISKECYEHLHLIIQEVG